MPNWRRLEKKLRRGIDLTRVETARALAVWGGDRAVTLLIGATGDGDARVRVEALCSLAHLKADCARERFLSALESADEAEQRAGLDGIAAIRVRDAAPVVAGFLDSANDEVVAAAIRALGRVTEVRLPPAVVLFAEDPREEVRAAVLDALFERPDREAIAVVRAGLTDKSERVRAGAVWAAFAVARREPTLLVPVLLDSSRAVAALALDALAVLLGHLPLDGFGPIARPWLAPRDGEALAARVLALLPEVEERFEGAWFDVVRFRAAEGDRAVIEDLKWAIVNERDCRAVAIEELAKLDFEQAAPRFRSMAEDFFERAAVRVAANAALARFGDRVGEAAFLRALESRRDEVRGMAFECAPWAKCASVIAALRTRLPDADAIVALGRAGDHASQGAFDELAANTDGDRERRVDALWALAAVADRNASGRLERLAASDGDSVVREAASRALELMGVETVLEPLAEPPRVNP